ncbi:MAG: hypothetical protein PVI90_01065 [Desulfobacteraceae bacterium]
MADTFDMYFQGKEQENISGFKFFTAGFNRTIGVRGFWKLILQWFKRFMTTKGSDPTRPDEGTEFPNLIGSNISSMTDVRDIVLLAIEDCNSQMLIVQQQTQPDKDELLLTAVLTKFEPLGDDGFEAWVTISNVENTELTIQLPQFATKS